MTATTFGATPAAAVITECLRAQKAVPERSWLARLLGRSPLAAESRPWYLGALGELETARRLGSLDESWAVLHAVPVGDRGSDIDHVLVSPAGVFTVNSKFHDGAKVWLGGRRILVNGQKTDHLRNSRYEAERVGRILTRIVEFAVPVTPLLVLVHIRSLTVKERPTDVVVLRETDVVRWLRRRPMILDPERVKALAEAVAEPTTWSTVSPPSVVEIDAFDELRREVREAKRVRALWGGGFFLSALAASASLLIPLVQT